ncbi:LacI family DNA-binding transcriptional regulator [Streptomyces sp. NPDC001797]|uniref:LacI family DNA-binding transcriptional regulator n=1 Tax=Streptomyces sp. 900105755 TaxID=3154389 RepID=A0ABV1TDG3_9ACTN
MTPTEIPTEIRTEIPANLRRPIVDGGRPAGGAADDAPRPPLYAQVKRTLLEAIASGEYSPGVPFVTQREICERFGVSHATAVRALNELAAEGWVVRRRGLGTFVAEQPGRGVRRGASADRAIACILQFQGPHVSQILAGVEAACADLGYRLYLRHCEGDPERESRALLDAVRDGVSGIVVYPAEGTGGHDGWTEVEHSGVPLVMADRYRPDLAHDAVVADNTAIGRELTKTLLAAGHRTIATLWDETDTSSVRDRFAGHVEALRQAGLPIRPDLTVLRRYRDLPSDQRRARLAALLGGDSPADVLLCSNGYVLAAAAHDLAALGYEVPGDVELAGMDDAGPFDVLPLTVAAVSLPSREIGDTAMRLLHRRVTERAAGRSPAAAPEVTVLPVTVTTRPPTAAHLRIVGGTALK